MQKEQPGKTKFFRVQVGCKLQMQLFADLLTVQAMSSDCPAEVLPFAPKRERKNCSAVSAESTANMQ